jgi:membrane associated rhomboid family serine protease
MLAEILPLVGAVPVYGPPVVVVAGPWLLLALMVAGPFAVLFTLVVLVAAAAALVGLIGGILAAPYLLVRRVRAYQAGHASMRAPAAPLVAGGAR